MILVHVHGEQVLLDIKGIHDSEDGLQFKEKFALKNLLDDQADYFSCGDDIMGTGEI